MKKLFLLTLITALAFTVQSQNPTDTIKSVDANKKGCFKLSSTSIIAGSNSYRRLDNGEHDDNHNQYSYYPQSGKMDYYGYGFNEDFTRKGFIGFELGMNPWSNKLGNYNKKQELTFSVFYSGSNLEDYYSTEYFTTPGDTFMNNGISYQTDTVARYDHTFVKQANVIGIGAQYVFKTNPEKTVSLFTGVGLNASITMTSNIYESVNKDSAVMMTLSGNVVDYYNLDNGYFLGNELYESNFKPDPTIFTSVYIPFGINFRLSKKKEILNQLNLFVRGNLGLETEFPVGDKAAISPFAGFAMGFKFNFK